MENIETYKTSASAKVNLFLRVCGRLPNGYHRLYTVMQEIDFSDELIVSIGGEGPSEIVVECEGRSDIDPKKNLCYKAADRFYASLHNKLDAEGSSDGRYAFPRTVISLKKNIPSESGMGGGSSDAASVLIILQEHYGNPFTEEELGKLAVNVGADVPFFLYGGTCLCERVGEEVTPIASLADLPILIVKPSAGVSTPECFKAIDSAELEEFDGEAYAEYISHLTEQKESPADKLGSFLSGGELLVNDLQAPAVSAVPQIGKIIEALKDAGAPFAAMTGSGSAVFALFDDEKKAAEVSEAVSSDPRTEDCVVILTKTV